MLCGADGANKTGGALWTLAGCGAGALIGAGASSETGPGALIGAGVGCIIGGFFADSAAGCGGETPPITDDPPDDSVIVTGDDDAADDDSSPVEECIPDFSNVSTYYTLEESIRGVPADPGVASVYPVMLFGEHNLATRDSRGAQIYGQWGRRLFNVDTRESDDGEAITLLHSLSAGFDVGGYGEVLTTPTSLFPMTGGRFLVTFDDSRDMGPALNVEGVALFSGVGDDNPDRMRMSEMASVSDGLSDDTHLATPIGGMLVSTDDGLRLMLVTSEISTEDGRGLGNGRVVSIPARIRAADSAVKIHGMNPLQIESAEFVMAGSFVGKTPVAMHVEAESLDNSDFISSGMVYILSNTDENSVIDVVNISGGAVYVTGRVELSGRMMSALTYTAFDEPGERGEISRRFLMTVSEDRERLNLVKLSVDGDSSESLSTVDIGDVNPIFEGEEGETPVVVKANGVAAAGAMIALSTDRQLIRMFDIADVSEDGSEQWQPVFARDLGGPVANVANPGTLTFETDAEGVPTGRIAVTFSVPYEERHVIERWEGLDQPPRGRIAVMDVREYDAAIDRCEEPVGNDDVGDDDE